MVHLYLSTLFQAHERPIDGVTKHLNNQNYGGKNIEEIPIELGNYENKNTIQKALRTKLELTKKEIQSETKLKPLTRQPKKK